jgi:hypothetical protein
MIMPPMQDALIIAYLLMVVLQPDGTWLRWWSEFASLSACRQATVQGTVGAPNYGRGNTMS